MCKPNEKPQTTSQQQDTKLMSGLEHELEITRKQVELMQLRASAEFNSSPAGQMQRQFETYQRMAKPLSESNFVPDAFKGKIGDCIIAVEVAARLGVPPLTVMQNLCVVKGKPTWMSKFLIGCVNTCGRYTTLDYKIFIDGPVGDVQYKTWQKGADGRNHEIQKAFDKPTLDNLVCTAYATEKATGKVLTSPPVSVRIAIQEGWYTKDGSKWPSMTELMLRYRAASMWVSTFAPEMAMGFRTTEEITDIVDAEYEEVTAPVLPPASATTAIEQAKEKLRNRAAVKTDNNKPSKIDMP